MSTKSSKKYFRQHVACQQSALLSGSLDSRKKRRDTPLQSVNKLSANATGQSSRLLTTSVLDGRRNTGEEIARETADDLKKKKGSMSPDMRNSKPHNKTKSTQLSSVSHWKRKKKAEADRKSTQSRAQSAARTKGAQKKKKTPSHVRPFFAGTSGDAPDTRRQERVAGRIRLRTQSALRKTSTKTSGDDGHTS